MLDDHNEKVKNNKNLKNIKKIIDVLLKSCLIVFFTFLILSFLTRL